MPPRKEPDKTTSAPLGQPAMTPEDREAQMAAYADALAERQLRDGTASAQVIVHYLKGASERDRLEREKIRHENLRLEAQVEQIRSQATSAALMEEVLKALKIYAGVDDDDEGL